MKCALVLFLFTVILTESWAQSTKVVGKGEQCNHDGDCIRDQRNLRCVNNYCGCRKGERQELESHADNTHVYICSPVLGRGCNRNEDCSNDLDNSKCNLNERLCECKKEDGCTPLKDKGEECTIDNECINDARRMKCLNYHCGCRNGERQEEKTAADGSSQTVCTNIVGLGCTHDEECYADLHNAKCNLQSQTCECLKEDGCSGASTMALIALLPMVLLSLGLLKSW